jgi:hypothetical protein
MYDIYIYIYIYKCILPVHYRSAGGGPYKDNVMQAGKLCLGVAGWLVLTYVHRAFVSPLLAIHKLITTKSDILAWKRHSCDGWGV